MTAVDVVGNNLANLNTPGYKASAVSFRDLVTESLGAGLGETQVGFGTGRPFTTREFTQGAIQSSTGLLDGAIEGDGFFILRDAQDQMLYTRAGQLPGRQPRLSDHHDRRESRGLDGRRRRHRQLRRAYRRHCGPRRHHEDPIATTNFSMDLNLNSNAVNGAASGTFSTPMQVYDSLGNSHTLTVTFTRTTTANQWTYAVTIPAPT